MTIDMKDSKAQVRRFATKALRRCHALGAASVTLNDVEQECWVAWCLARDAYDASRGVPFAPFFHRGMIRHVNRWISKNFERFYEGTVAVTLDAPVASSDGDLDTLGAILADEQAIDMERELSRRGSYNLALERLSPRAADFVRLLEEQPEELLQSYRKLEAKAQHAREMGCAYNRPSRLTAAMIFDVLGASRYERGRIIEEVSQIGDLLSRPQ